MLPEMEPLLARLQSEGPRSFARWDATLFDLVVSGPVQLLHQAMIGQPDAGAVLTAYLQLAQEGVGIGAVRQVRGSAWTSFLERCLVELIPRFLPLEKVGQRVPLLVKVWNLGEGLLCEPSWLDRYLTACARRVTNLSELEAFLIRTLEPVLAPVSAAAWVGPFAVTVLDLRELHDDFLPGEVALSTPTVLRVEDRRQTGLQAGVLLRKGGRSEILGLTEGLGDHPEQWEPPMVEFRDGAATVDGRGVEFPWLRCCHRHALARAGFVAACAVDSQRLWILETP